MKDLKAIVFIIIVLILTAVSAYPQQRFGGTVIEVIDGKTVVIEMPSRKLTAVLQYIDVPEPEQPLHQTVKEHLEKLLLNKTVEFQARILYRDRTVGRLMLDGTDIGLQLLRDGAAWHSIPEKSGQERSESENYRYHETQAKMENRGIWSIANLKPAWEFRAERDEQNRILQEKLWRQTYSKSSFAEEMAKKRGQISGQQTAPQAGIWADVYAGSQFQSNYVGGLYSGFDNSDQVGYVLTPSFFLNLSGSDFSRKVESRVMYLYTNDQRYYEKKAYVIGFLTASKDYKFLKSNSVTIEADNQKFNLRLAERGALANYSSVEEILVYRISRSQLEKLAKAKKITVRLGRYSGNAYGEYSTYINNLLNTTN